MGQIWSIMVHWAVGATEVEIEQAQEAGVLELKKKCPHIEQGLVDIKYGTLRDKPEYDEEGNAIPLTAVYQELSVECDYCAVGEWDAG